MLMGLARGKGKEIRDPCFDASDGQRGARLPARTRLDPEPTTALGTDSDSRTTDVSRVESPLRGLKDRVSREAPLGVSQARRVSSHGIEASFCIVSPDPVNPQAAQQNCTSALYGSVESLEGAKRKMTPWTRFARLFFVSFLVLAVPTLYFLYPGSSHSPPGVPNTYEAGGIDSPHYRTPKAPDIEEEHVRDWEDELAFGGEGDGTGRVPLGKVLDSEEDFEEGSSSSGHSDWTSSSSDAWMTGDVIMPKLGNATAKAELGRAAWRVLHLMTLRYPDEPSPEDRQALKGFFHLFSRLYPCGECATEFQKLLKEYPPQTGSRKSASLWLCHVHNQVNARLGKPEFDCLTLDATYDCGCGDDPLGTASASAGSARPTASRPHYEASGYDEDDRRGKGVFDDWAESMSSTLKGHDEVERQPEQAVDHQYEDDDEDGSDDICGPGEEC